MKTSTFLQAFHSAIHTMIQNKYSHNDLLKTLSAWDRDGEKLPLKRDQYVYKMLRETLLHHISVYETSCCYEYQGKIYSVQKGIDFKKSVEYLYTLKLSQKNEWDKMKRGSVWNFRDHTDSQLSDFKIYGELKEKDH